MSISGPLASFCFCKSDCIEHLRSSFKGLQGPVEEKVDTPNSIHALFGEYLADATDGKNSSQKNTKVDVDHFFSELIQDPIFEDQGVRGYLQETVVPILLPALQQLSIEQPSNPVMWLADWLTINNPQPD